MWYINENGRKVSGPPAELHYLYTVWKYSSLEKFAEDIAEKAAKAAVNSVFESISEENRKNIKVS